MSIAPDPEPLRAFEPLLVPASGGMDSTVLCWWLTSHQLEHLACVFSYGQHTRQTEALTARRVLPPSTPVVEVDLGSVFGASRSHLLHAPDLWTTPTSRAQLHLEYRNMLLLAAAAAVAEQHGCGAVAPALIQSNLAENGDTSEAFLEAAGAAISLGGSVTLQMPFLHLRKPDVVRLGIALGAPIESTYSCQLAPSIPCGACANCVDRLDALATITEHHRTHDA